MSRPSRRAKHDAGAGQRTCSAHSRTCLVRCWLLGCVERKLISIPGSCSALLMRCHRPSAARGSKQAALARRRPIRSAAVGKRQRCDLHIGVRRTSPSREGRAERVRTLSLVLARVGQGVDKVEQDLRQAHVDTERREEEREAIEDLHAAHALGGMARDLVGDLCRRKG